jgi:hypothetical protein
MRAVFLTRPFFTRTPRGDYDLPRKQIGPTGQAREKHAQRVEISTARTVSMQHNADFSKSEVLALAML